MHNSFQFDVILKKAGRAVGVTRAADQENADNIGQAWYAQGDGHTYEIVPRQATTEQVEPKIEPANYLTQSDPVTSIHAMGGPYPDYP